MDQKKLRVGIIGMGHWGPNLIRNFYDHSETRVEWICDLDSDRRHLAEKSYPGVRTTANWTEIVNSPDVDAVIIASPTSTHFEITLECLRSGKHVFVEKPLTTNTEQAQILTALARHKSLKLFVGHVFLFNPAVQYIKKTLEAKVLGQLYYAYFSRTNLGPVRADVNALWDLAPHDVAILHYVMGENPDWITANGSSFINTPVHDVVFTHLRYKNGFAANLHVSWLDPRKVREVVIVGSEKMLVFDDTDLENPIKIYHKGIDSTYTELKVTDTIFQFRKSIFQGELSTPVIPAGEPLKAECQCFIDWVLRDIPHSNSDALSLSVVRTLELASESLVNLGKPMPFSSKDLSRDSEGMRPFAETPAQPVEVHLQ